MSISTISNTYFRLTNVARRGIFEKAVEDCGKGVVTCRGVRGMKGVDLTCRR